MSLGIFACTRHFREVCSCGRLIACCRCPEFEQGPATVIHRGCITCRAVDQQKPFPIWPAEARLAFSLADALERVLRNTGEGRAALSAGDTQEANRLLEAAEKLGWRTTDERAALGNRRGPTGGEHGR